MFFVCLVGSRSRCWKLVVVVGVLVSVVVACSSCRCPYRCKRRRIVRVEDYVMVVLMVVMVGWLFYFHGVISSFDTYHCHGIHPDPD